MLRIVHLSDFHLSNVTLKDFQSFTMKSLITDLQRHNNETKIDFIAFSGDLLDKGGISFNNDIELGFFSFMESVIEPIIKSLNLPIERFLIVPGNHDIQKNKNDKYQESGLFNELNSIEAINNYIDHSGEDMRGSERILLFKNFEKQIYSNKNDNKLSNFQSCFKFNINDKKVGVTCFNSSWRCFNSNEDQGRLLVGERQILNAREYLEDCEVKIAIMHHPIDWLSSIESDMIKRFITRDYNLLLCGHIHEGQSTFNTDMFGSIFISIAPSNWSHNIRSKDSYNGYSIIDLKADKIIISNRKYSYEKEGFQPNLDLGNDEGKVIYHLLKSEELMRRNIDIEICEKINLVKTLTLNEHLLSYRTDTNAPKNLNDIFVLPRLVSNKEFDIKQFDSKKGIKERLFVLDDLCSHDNNILLLGKKESGKTIMLDKLLLEFSGNYDKYKKIPIFIDFDNLLHSKIETDISLYLNIGIMDVPNFLNEHNIVLLIDNITYSYKKEFKYKELDLLLKKYPKIMVIATCRNITEDEVPIEILENKFLATLTQVHIKPFKTKEIRYLANKWFSNEKLGKEIDIEKIIRIFGTLNIPRTPLAVSMFLWIIEHQENYKPVNNATMLENFVEKLFKKHSIKEIYYDEFDFKNKQRLIADIALHMYKQKKPNYSISSKDLFIFVSDYLKSRKFLYKTDEVIAEFHNVGILKQTIEEYEMYTSFSLNCFFQYFLMKNMDYRQEFKEWVLHEDNYLHFEDEIDYYTGIKRDQEEILELVVDRMSDEFKGVLDFFSTLEHGFDTMFLTNRTIVSQLDNSFVKKLTESNKPTEEELDSYHDKMLDQSGIEEGIIDKEELFSQMQRLDKIWSLSAKVLKNTEETEKENLKTKCFKQIIKCSIAFANLYKAKLSELLENLTEEEIEDMDLRLKIIEKAFPFIHQVVVFSLIGTAKLLLVIKEDVEEKLKNPLLQVSSFSDFEKFLSVFLYADLKGKNFIRYVRELLNESKHSYINDIIFFKIINYYIFNSNSKESDFEYENLLSELIAKSKGESLKEKQQIIERLREKREEILGNEAI